MAININEFMEIEGDINKSVDKAIRSIRKMKVIEVALERLKPSKDNFYQITDIDELKENIKEFGLIEPIVAMETENDDYEIISGHRRCEAFRQLAEENDEYKKISCRIIAQIPELKKKILLVSANKQTRDKTDWETTLEINKMKEYLEVYKKDTGVKMSPRQKIGEMTGRSKSNIGWHITIYRNLSPEMMERYKNGDINLRNAEYVAGLSITIQNDLAQKIDGEISREKIEEYVLSIRPQETKPQAIQLEPEKPTEEHGENDDENSQVNQYGVYKEKYINEIDLTLLKKYKTTIRIHWVYDERKQRYAVGEDHRTATTGGGYSPSTKDAVFKTLNEAKEYIISYLSEFRELKEALKHCQDEWVQEIIAKLDLFPYEPEYKPENREISPEEKETSKNEMYNRLLEKMKVCGYENLEPCEQCKIATACPNCCKICSESCNCKQGCRKEKAEREERESCKNIEVDDESDIAKFASFPKKSWKKEEIQRQIERQIECLEFVDEILSAEWSKIVGKEYESKVAWYIRQDAANYIRKILGEIQQEIDEQKRKLE